MRLNPPHPTHSPNLQAAFGAPIGGVLFAVEEARSHWSRGLVWQCLLTAVCSCWFGGLLQPDTVPGILSFRLPPVTPTNLQWLRVLPHVALISGVCALWGALFNCLRDKLWSRRAVVRGKPRRVLEAMLITMLCMSVMLGAASGGRCLPTPRAWCAAACLCVLQGGQDVQDGGACFVLCEVQGAERNFGVLRGSTLVH